LRSSSRCVSVVVGRPASRSVASMSSAESSMRSDSSLNKKFLRRPTLFVFHWRDTLPPCRPNTLQ
jgi:hypothetical protein